MIIYKNLGLFLLLQFYRGLRELIYPLKVF